MMQMEDDAGALYCPVAAPSLAELRGPSTQEMGNGLQTVEDTTGASSKVEFSENHATGAPLRRSSRRQKSKLCSLSIEKEVYDRWCRVGAAEGLKTDTDIACYFVKQYEGTQVGAQSYARCVHCHAPLTLICTKCQQPSQGGQVLRGESAMVCGMDTSISQKHTVADVNQQDETEGCFSIDAGSHNCDGFDEIKPYMNSNHSPQNLPKASGSVNDDSEHDMNDDDKGNFHCSREESCVCESLNISAVKENPQGGILVSTSVDTEAVNCADNTIHSMIEIYSHGEGSAKVCPQADKERHHTKVFMCTHCQKTFRTAGGLTHHEKLHAKARPYKCHMCKATFKWSGNLKTHMDIHTQDKHHECQICGQCFKTVGGVKRHMKKHKHRDQVHLHENHHRKSPVPSEQLTGVRVHSGWNLEAKFSCSECSQTFDCEDKFTMHKKTHEVKEEIKCGECQKLFNKPQSLQKHTEKVHKKGEKPYKCSDCCATFASRARLTNHLRTHTGEKPYICDFCGTAFSLYSTLSVHRRTHTGETPYQCQQCDEKFRWKKSLDYHMFKHTKTYASLCHLCGAWFRTPDHLADHLRRHANTRDFKCHMCDKGFKTKSDLYSHTMYIHPQKAKSFKCPDCELAFVTKSMLKKHSRKHTGERPYQCEHCSKTFSYLSSLSAHRRLHEGKKQHTCEICGAAFVMQWGLTLHMRKHTGEKPYQCKLCGEAFSWHSGLKNHMRKHET